VPFYRSFIIKVPLNYLIIMFFLILEVVIQTFAAPESYVMEIYCRFALYVVPYINITRRQSLIRL
jgi:hypothetical protein